MSTTTLYRSPTRLLSYAGEAITSWSKESTERTRIKLENIHDLQIEGTSYSREQIELSLKNFNEGNWSLHAIVFQQKGLLKFLEEIDFQPHELGKSYSFHYKPGFVDFISPYFSYSFNLAAAAMILKEDYASLNDLCSYSAFISPASRHLAYESINNYLHAISSQLSKLEWNEFIKDESKLHFIFSSSWQGFFNKLPSEFNALYKELIDRLFSVLQQFRFHASKEYLKELSYSLQELSLSADIHTEIVELQKNLNSTTTTYVTQRIKKGFIKREDRFLWALGGFCFIAVIVIIIASLPKKEKSQDGWVDDSFAEKMDNNSAEDELNSSVNEKNFKYFLFSAKGQHIRGEKSEVATGEIPFLDISIPLPDEGNAQLLIKNNTKYDAVLLYFSSDNTLVNRSSHVYSVFIKSGEEYKTRFQPDYGRFNFILGKRWMELERPTTFKLVESNLHAQGPAPDNVTGTWLVKEYFDSTAYLEFLTHDITVNNIPQPHNHTIGRPEESNPGTLPGDGPGEKKLEWTLTEKDNKIVLSSKGGLYVYESNDNFTPADSTGINKIDIIK